MIAKSIRALAFVALVMPFAAQAQQPPKTVTIDQIAAYGDPMTDLKPFLAADVPEDIRNAALRIVWTNDSSIRDYKNPARVYAMEEQETIATGAARTAMLAK